MTDDLKIGGVPPGEIGRIYRVCCARCRIETESRIGGKATAAAAFKFRGWTKRRDGWVCEACVLLRRSLQQVRRRP